MYLASMNTQNSIICLYYETNLLTILCVHILILIVMGLLVILKSIIFFKKRNNIDLSLEENVSGLNTVIFFNFGSCIKNLDKNLCVCAKLLQSCLTLCHPMDRGLLGSSVHWILQARILEWVAMPLSSWVSMQIFPNILTFGIKNINDLHFPFCSCLVVA